MYARFHCNSCCWSGSDLEQYTEADQPICPDCGNDDIESRLHETQIEINARMDREHAAWVAYNNLPRSEKDRRLKDSLAEMERRIAGARRSAA